MAVGLEHGQVAGVDPAALEGLLRGHGALQVALHRDVAAEHDLAQGLPVGRRLGHGGRVHHGHAVLQRVAHTLAAVQARLIREVLAGSRGAFDGHAGRAVDLGEPVHVRDLEADGRHALDQGRRRRGAGHHASHPLRDVIAGRGSVLMMRL